MSEPKPTPASLPSSLPYDHAEARPSSSELTRESESIPALGLILGEALWKLFDLFFLFRLGSIYYNRLEEFYCDHTDHDEEGDKEVNVWRTKQQDEWNMLSTTLALLGTMNAAIIKVSPHPGSVSVSLWLGAAGLSLAGVFMVQYYSIRSFPIANSQLRQILAPPSRITNKKLISRRLIAMAISGPPLITLWSTALFVIGILIFIGDTEFDQKQYKAFAFIPICAGVFAVIVSLVLGEYLGTALFRERMKEGTRRWCHHRKAEPTKRQTIWEKFVFWFQHQWRKTASVQTRDRPATRSHLATTTQSESV